MTEETLEGEEHPVANMENREMWMEKVKEESTNEITLDEWKTIHKDRTKLEFNIWKSNQGADWQWKDLFS